MASMDDLAKNANKSASVINKRSVPIVIQTTKHLVRGNFHVRGVMRIIDELTFEDKFVAITEAEIINPNGSIFIKASFIAVNRHEIVWMAPEEDLKSRREND